MTFIWTTQLLCNIINSDENQVIVRVCKRFRPNPFLVCVVEFLLLLLTFFCRINMFYCKLIIFNGIALFYSIILAKERSTLWNCITQITIKLFHCVFIWMVNVNITWKHLRIKDADALSAAYIKRPAIYCFAIVAAIKFCIVCEI